MVPYTNTISQPLLTLTTNYLGTTLSYSNGPVHYRKLTVTNGNVQGDKHKPNPIKFTKRISTRVQSRTSIKSILASRPASQIVEGGMVFGGEGYTYNAVRPELLAKFGEVAEAVQLKLYDQLRNGPNLAVDAAEWRSTKRLIGGSLKLTHQMSDFADTVVANQHNKRWRKFDYVTRKWLELRYGWGPLTYSIYDSLDQLGRKLSIEPLIVQARAGSGVVETHKSFAVPATYTGYQRLESSGRVRNELQCRFIPPNMLDLHDWTSLSPATIAWELTTLSFMWDWVVNVGDLLSLWENYLHFRATFVDGYETITVRDDITYDANYVFQKQISYWPNGQPIDTTYYRRVTQTSVGRISYKDRRILTALPMPPSVIPRVRINLNATRLTDAIAIFGKKFALVERLLTKPWVPREKRFF